MRIFLGKFLFLYKLIKIIFSLDTTYIANSLSEDGSETLKDSIVPCMYTLRIYDIIKKETINQLELAFKIIFSNQFEDMKLFLFRIDSYSHIGNKNQIFTPKTFIYSKMNDLIQFEISIPIKCANLSKEQFLSEVHTNNDLKNKRLYSKKIFYEDKPSELCIVEPLEKHINNVSVSVDVVSKKHLETYRNEFYSTLKNFEKYHRQKKLDFIDKNNSEINIINKQYFLFCDYYIDKRSTYTFFEYMKRNEEIGKKDIANCNYIDIIFFSENLNQFDIGIKDAFNKFLNSKTIGTELLLEHPFYSIFINKPKKTYYANKFSTFDPKKNDEFRKKFLKTDSWTFIFDKNN